METLRLSLQSERFSCVDYPTLNERMQMITELTAATILIIVLLADIALMASGWLS